MGYELKTKQNDGDVFACIELVESERKKADAYRLLDLFSETTGYEAKMWGAGIIGFGSYNYKYVSGHEGQAPLTGFSPKKTRFSLYMATGDPEREKFLDKLGKHKAGKACVYINKLEDVDEEVLVEMIRRSVSWLKETYPER
ncbi:DUF1801 domain-containing protein [Alteribacter natronophilus]|uniref:DUF1801 domain-containing protein n=1 Tax=Alteribacter natronophilus TaxID=2583810 RepID=UPI00110D9381|nr:DUF1801 domain-containing protein [Alteribacter natronophilus]TMW70152.1 DUF1801 domain-containing protein [Alteribacter natronophilus]